MKKTLRAVPHVVEIMLRSFSVMSSSSDRLRRSCLASHATDVSIAVSVPTLHTVSVFLPTFLPLRVTRLYYATQMRLASSKLLPHIFNIHACI